MKKFLSIKNSQGIYVARASFSSDETVIDFVNNNSNSSDNCKPKPVSIVVTPDQLPSLSNTTIAIDSNRGQLFRIDRNQFDHIETASVSSNSIVVNANPSKKKRITKILRALHLKKSPPKMADDRSKEAHSRKPHELSLAIDDTQQPNPSTSSQPSKIAKSKGRTAALVKKFSLTPKKTYSKDATGESKKKSAIPLRTSTSVDTITNVIQSRPKSSNTAAAANAAESNTHYSMSEMNLVNIDYQQEGVTDGLDVGVKIGQTHYRAGNRFTGIVADENSANNPFNRSWNTSSNLSIRSGLMPMNNARSSSIGGSSASSHEKLQITISGKKRATVNEAQASGEVIGMHQPKYGGSVNDTERQHIERKALAMHVPPKKLNISHDLTLMNTIGVPSITQASPIPSYRITSGSIKNVVQSRAGIKTQSTMHSQRTVDISASSVDVEAIQINRTNPSKLLAVTSFDADESDDIIADHQHIDKNASSLLTEIIEAEKRTSMTDSSEDGRRLSGIGTSIEATSSDHESALNASSKAKDNVNQATAKLSSDAYEKSASGGDEQYQELMQTLTQSNGAKMLQSTGETIEIGESRPEPSTSGMAQSAIQFEVGKQVRPIFTSNQNLHHTTYLTHDNEPTTTYTSIVSSTMSLTDTHNQSNTHDNASAEPAHENNPSETNVSTDSQIHLHFQPNRPPKIHSRRRIAYLDSPVDGNKY